MHKPSLSPETIATMSTADIMRTTDVLPMAGWATLAGWRFLGSNDYGATETARAWLTFDATVEADVYYTVKSLVLMMAHTDYLSVVVSKTCTTIHATISHDTRDDATLTVMIDTRGNVTSIMNSQPMKAHATHRAARSAARQWTQWNGRG